MIQSLNQTNAYYLTISIMSWMCASKNNDGSKKIFFLLLLSLSLSFHEISLKLGFPGPVYGFMSLLGTLASLR